MPADSAAARGSWKLVFKVAVSFGLLAFLARRVDFSSVGGFLADADPLWLAAAFVLYLGGQAISAIKWRRLALALGFEGGAGRFIAHYFIGVFFNAFGFGTVGGDVVRALYLAGGGGRRALAVNTVVADRVSGLLVLLGIALVALGWLHNYELPAGIYWTVVVLSGILVGGWRLLPHVLPLVLPETNRLRQLVERDLAPYWNDGRLLAEIGALSLVFHFSQILVLMVLIRALDLPVPWSYCFIFGPLVNILAAIPVSLNGLGVREGGYVFFLAHIGIARDAAVGFALVWFAIVMLAGAVGGAVYLAYGERRRSPT